MAGSTFGNQFKITTWGESHGKAVGVVIDGCPAGLALTESDIQYYLNLRKPGQSRYTTPRKEEDAVEIMSGIFEGRTTGTPISLIVYNKNARSSDYSDIALTHIIPSGWEIYNERMTTDPEKANSADSNNSYSYRDIRDDRVLTYFNLKRGQYKTFTVRLQATYAGTFVLPAIQCEAMYDAGAQARTRAGKAIVER